MKLTFLTLAALTLTTAPILPQRSPVIGGLARDALPPATRGAILLGELGCTACHGAGERAGWIDHKTAPRLDSIRPRVAPEWIEAFLVDPHGVKPGTTMPDALRRLPAEERADAATALTHYLVASSTGAEFTPRSPDPVAAVRGRELFHTIGCVACHAPRDENGDEITLVGSVPLGRLERKYAHDGLVAFLEAPHRVRPSGRMPDFGLSPQEAHDLSHYLLARAPAASPEPFEVDPEMAHVGRAHFTALGCSQCHTDAERTRTPMNDPTRGCLSESPGAWPHYALTASQRGDIRTALASDAVPTDDELIRQQLTAWNCVACHARGELGGVADERDPYFTTRDPHLGESGRTPPRLTGVGAKLQAPWLERSIAHGQRIRERYLATRMPGFGNAVAASLSERLKRADRLPAVAYPPLPKDRKEREAHRNLGHEIIGNRGMNCISCHTFGGRESGGAMAAVDIANSTTARLEKDWFYRYLLDPAGLSPGTVMPMFFPGGKSVRTDLADGDAKRQIDAMWHYLTKGRNARQPRGMVRPRLVLEVGDEAVMLRRKIQGTGKRGIAVGYPLGVHLTFDAEDLGLNQIWWGDFLDASGVWTGQGSGAAGIRSRDRATLPKGPAFVVLSEPDAPWPAATRRELGHAFRGYDLDELQQPTFRYVCEGVTIEDAPRPVPVADRRPMLRRTLTLTGTEAKTLTFRAAIDAQIEPLADGRFRVGKSLRMAVTPADRTRTRTAGDARDTLELLVDVPIRGGGGGGGGGGDDDDATTLTIDYTWQEGPR